MVAFGWPDHRMRHLEDLAGQGKCLKKAARRQ